MKNNFQIYKKNVDIFTCNHLLRYTYVVQKRTKTKIIRLQKLKKLKKLAVCTNK